MPIAGERLRRLLAILRHGNVYERHGAAEALSEAGPDPEVLSALVEALNDTGYYETPGDYDAPPFYHGVAEAAAESLGRRAVLALSLLAVKARQSPDAAVLVARLMSHCADQGLPLLRDLAAHPFARVREAALSTLRSLSQDLDLPVGLPQQLAALNDQDSSVTFSAVRAIRDLLKTRPELDLNALAPESLLEALERRLRAHPEAATFADAFAFFRTDPRVLTTFLDLAANGSQCAAERLLPFLEQLDDAAIARLLPARKTPPLIALLGALGERVPSWVVPELAELLHHEQLDGPAAIALLRIPSGVTIVEPLLDDLFVAREELRAGILKYHPRPEQLAVEVPERLRRRWLTTKNLSFLRGLEALGPLAVSELPWLMEQLEPYGVSDNSRTYAISIICRFGEKARPAYPKLMRLLDYSDTRYSVLRGLTWLGPLAAEDFLLLLEVLKEESSRWSVFEKNNDLLRLNDALASLRGESVKSF